MKKKTKKRMTNVKTKKKAAKPKRASKNSGSALKKAVGKKVAAKKAASKKAAAKEKSPSKKIAARTKAAGRKTGSASGPRKQIRRDDRIVDTPFSLRQSRAGSAGQSGDLQGLSNVDRADSESVDELLEEGNAFEADVVAGVEEAGNSEGKEVHTHEVPEDDVPSEYLDKD